MMEERRVKRRGDRKGGSESRSERGEGTIGGRSGEDEEGQRNRVRETREQKEI